MSLGLLRCSGRAIVFLLCFLFSSLPVLATDLSCSAIDVYVREGCPHCADARLFLQRLNQRHADLEIRYHDVNSDPGNLEELLALSKAYGVEQPGVPSFLICDNFYVGFSEQAGSGDWIEGRLVNTDSEAGDFNVQTPLGVISPGDLGLPAFTILLGLVDGFNPCAMWVLLFLLSILVNIRGRRRIILIAGTFVLVSGVVYFVFMAAWLNLFLLIGFARWLQIAIGTLALAIAAIHIKDFFAFGSGISLSIPDSVKPGLYMRMRRILHAQSLLAALLGVTVVAIMVNIVELLCTAGLPALYTQVLTLSPMPVAQYYAYLVLYNTAYIFDDALMVTVAVYSLNKFKLQEKQGRWLKLISGLVVLALGVLLLLAPDYLF